MRKSIFHEDWWLNALAPGRWREITCVRSNRIAGSLRFVERTQSGMRICEMPPITRILGPIASPGSGSKAARIRATHSIVTELLEQLAGHAHVDMTLDPEFSDVAPFLHMGYDVKAHPTFLLDCNRPVEVLWAGLRDKTRNVIRRARETLAVREFDDVSLFVEFYLDNLLDEEPYFDMARLGAAIGAARVHGQCRIVAAFDPNGAAQAMVVFLWDEKYVYYFLSSRDKKAAHVGAVSLLLWTGIELAQSKGLQFDFDGGLMKEARYKFLASFGGELANRFDVSRSTPLYQIQTAARKVPRAVARRGVALASKYSSGTATGRESRMAIDIKAAIKPLARGIAQLPGVSRILRLPGVRKSLARLPRAGRLLANGAVANAWERRHPFDIEHGTDTSGFVAVADLEQLAHEAARAEGHPYASSQPSIIRAALTALPPLHSFSFVDIGCGKGRPLLVASEMPFSNIVGVELSASLAKTARLNADTIKGRFPTRTPIRVVVGDAGRFPLPDGNVVLFLYNPFGEAIIAKVVEAVNAALKQAQRTIYVVYYNPVFGHCFDASPLLSRHSATTLPYAASERGFGPDMEDPVVVWQGGIPLGAARSGADARIEIVDPRYRVRLVPNEGRRPMAVTSPLLIATSLAFGFQTSAMD